MDAQQQEVIRAQFVEQQWWRWFTTMRNIVADCTANQNILETMLEERTLPITFENLESVWASLTDGERAQFAPADGRRIKPRTLAPVAEVPAAAVEVEVEGVLPVEYTRRRITKELSGEEYRQLLKKYGKEAIENRVNGRS